MCESQKKAEEQEEEGDGEGWWEAEIKRGEDRCQSVVVTESTCGGSVRDLRDSRV